MHLATEDLPAHYVIQAQLAQGNWGKLTDPQNPRKLLQFATLKEALAYLERYSKLNKHYVRCDYAHGLQMLRLFYYDESCGIIVDYTVDPDSLTMGEAQSLTPYELIARCFEVELISDKPITRAHYNWKVGDLRANGYAVSAKRPGRTQFYWHAPKEGNHA